MAGESCPSDRKESKNIEIGDKRKISWLEEEQEEEEEEEEKEKEKEKVEEKVLLVNFQFGHRKRSFCLLTNQRQRWKVEAWPRTSRRRGRKRRRKKNEGKGEEKKKPHTPIIRVVIRV